ncbi:hypothetical protein MIMGU_mgv11b018798mg, partial [Erythranthe guttata]
MLDPTYTSVHSKPSDAEEFGSLVTVPPPADQEGRSRGLATQTSTPPVLPPARTLAASDTDLRLFAAELIFCGIILISSSVWVLS